MIPESIRTLVEDILITTDESELIVMSDRLFGLFNQMSDQTERVDTFIAVKRMMGDLFVRTLLAARSIPEAGFHRFAIENIDIISVRARQNMERT